MAKTYFISNLPDSPDIENLYHLFDDEAGEITRFKLIRKHLYHRDWTYGFIQVTDDSLMPALLKRFNGCEFQERRLAFSCVKPLTPAKLTLELKNLIEVIAARLVEETPKSVRQIEQIVTWCGVDFAKAILEETLKIEANGGMMTLNQSRRRTPGGVFFHLAKPRIYWPVAEKIFPQLKKKIPRPVVEPAASEPFIVPPEIQAELNDLRLTEYDLENQLLEMKKTGATSGMFSLTRQLATIKQKIVQLQREYPEL